MCRSLEPLAAFIVRIRLKNRDAGIKPIKSPACAIADVIVQNKRLILREHADGVYAGVDAVRQRKIDFLNPGIYAVAERKINDAIPSAKRHGRLCNILR